MDVAQWNVLKQTLSMNPKIIEAGTFGRKCSESERCVWADETHLLQGKFTSCTGDGNLG